MRRECRKIAAQQGVDAVERDQARNLSIGKRDGGNQAAGNPDRIHLGDVDRTHRGRNQQRSGFRHTVSNIQCKLRDELDQCQFHCERGRDVEQVRQTEKGVHPIQEDAGKHRCNAGSPCG
ncbi:TPA: hypothetical protein ACGY79_001694 [Stenotrophomonas maltophilia]